MSESAVSINVPHARNAATSLGTSAAAPEACSVKLRIINQRGDFVSESIAALRVIDEVAQELRLLGKIFSTRADLAVQADNFPSSAAYEAYMANATAAYLAAQTGLQTSLDDAVGTDLVDLDDPTVEDGDTVNSWAHLGYIPLWADGGPVASDVTQGSLNDCWLLTGIGSIAAADPARLEQLITDNMDGTYTVNFPDGAVMVDDQFPVDASGDPLYAAGAVLWPAVLEKAWAFRDGGSYGDLADGTAHDVWTTFGAAEDRRALNPMMWSDPSDGDVVSWIKTQLDADLPVAARSDGAFGMGGSHTWVLTAVSDTTVTVLNPWGEPGIKPNPAGVGFLYYEGSEIDFSGDGNGAGIKFLDEAGGYLQVPIDVFTANFDHIDAVTSWSN